MVVFLKAMAVADVGGRRFLKNKSCWLISFVNIFCKAVVHKAWGSGDGDICTSGWVLLTHLIPGSPKGTNLQIMLQKALW